MKVHKFAMITRQGKTVFMSFIRLMADLYLQGRQD